MAMWIRRNRSVTNFSRNFFPCCRYSHPGSTSLFSRSSFMNKGVNPLEQAVERDCEEWVPNLAFSNLEKLIVKQIFMLLVSPMSS